MSLLTACYHKCWGAVMFHQCVEQCQDDVLEEDSEEDTGNE